MRILSKQHFRVWTSEHSLEKENEPMLWLTKVKRKKKAAEGKKSKENVIIFDILGKPAPTVEWIDNQGKKVEEGRKFKVCQDSCSFE